MMFGKFKNYIIYFIIISLISWNIYQYIKLNMYKSKIIILQNTNQGLSLKNASLESSVANLELALERQNSQMDILNKQAKEAQEAFEKWKNQSDLEKYGDILHILKKQSDNECENVMKKLQLIGKLRSSDL